MNINRLPVQQALPTTAAAPRFGASPHKAPLPLRLLGDFGTVGKTAVQHNQIIYALVIASRILFSRTPNERWENARRDVLGWYFWFMGGSLFQAALVNAIPKKDIKEILLHRPDAVKKMSFGKKALNLLLQPGKLWQIATDAQITERKEQVISGIYNKMASGAMTKKAGNTAIRNASELFKKAGHYRAGISLLGMGFTIALLGIGINFINMALTRSSLKKAQASQPGEGASPQQAMMPAFSGVNNNTPWTQQ